MFLGARKMANENSKEEAASVASLDARIEILEKAFPLTQKPPSLLRTEDNLSAARKENAALRDADRQTIRKNIESNGRHKEAVRESVDALAINDQKIAELRERLHNERENYSGAYLKLILPGIDEAQDLLIELIERAQQVVDVLSAQLEFSRNNNLPATRLLGRANETAFHLQLLRRIIE